MKKLNITGSIIEAYVFCPKQAWLLAHQFVGDQNNEFLEIGRLISDRSYEREKNEITIKGGKIDFIKKDNNKILIVEVKKSSKFIETAKMQLLYYIYDLKNKGIVSYGEVRIPEEKKIIKIYLDDNNEEKIKNLINEIDNLLKQEKMPEVKYSGKCKNCSYNEFCWS